MAPYLLDTSAIIDALNEKRNRPLLLRGRDDCGGCDPRWAAAHHRHVKDFPMKELELHILL